MNTLPQLRRSVLAAAERQASSAQARASTSGRAGRRRGWRRTPLISLAVALGLAGAAFASGVIQFGAPAPRSPFAIFTAPRTGDGALRPGTVRVLPISTPDPAGGAPWGMREFSTSRGLGCIEVARLVGGKLVAIGQDDAFGNDGRYHELSVASGGAGYGDWCSALDRYQRLYINGSWGEQPASAWHSQCYAPGAPVSEHTRELLMPAIDARRSGVSRLAEKLVVLPECPLQDERNLYFGLLGPDAKSVTYVLDGKRHTLATSGPEGAYLIVTRPTPGQLFKGMIGGGGVVPEYRPITELHYRDGATCHLTSKSWIGEEYACTPAMQVPVGYVAPADLSYTHAQVAAPLEARLLRTRQGRYELRLTFRSRVALTNAQSGYNFIWYLPGELHENHGGYTTESDIAAGQTVSTTTCPLPPGVIHGTVSLHEPNEVFKHKSEVVYAFKYEKVGVLVASFSVRVPGAPRPTSPETERPSPFASCSALMLRPRG
jgi:hypothetical protein